MQPITLHGVPHTLKFDSWWLDSPTPPNSPETQARQPMRRLAGLAGLVLLADLLFWGHGHGINVALFAAAIFAVAGAGLPLRQMARPAVILFLGLLPAVELVQPLSLAFLSAALLVALVKVHHPDLAPLWLGLSAAQRAARLPLLWAQAVLPARVWATLTETNATPRPRLPANWAVHLRNWAFPLGGALVFAGLMIGANPLFEQTLLSAPDLSDLLPRALFWGGIAALCTPLLLPPPAVLKAPALPAVRLPGFGINAGSTLRALITFNLVIGVQSLTDLTIFLGGAALPEGMSYAEYAHRGAYPLLATALLAGGFALAARPFVAEHRAIRPLMLLWLGQNVALCLSALLRLDLYMQAFGATYLRVYALIWIGLTAAVLLMIVWQALRSHTNMWLVLRGTALGCATLYACTFVNFAALIAERNLARAEPDQAYVCALGDYAAAPIQAALEDSMRLCYDVAAPQIDTWPEWGWRKARVRATLAQSTKAVE